MAANSEKQDHTVEMLLCKRSFGFHLPAKPQQAAQPAVGSGCGCLLLLLLLLLAVWSRWHL